VRAVAQVRLQTAATGGGIVGDSRYLPVAGLLDDDEESPHSEREAAACDLTHRADVHPQAASNCSVDFGPEPEIVALQASSLRILTANDGVLPSRIAAGGKARDQGLHSDSDVDEEALRVPQRDGDRGYADQGRWSAGQRWWAKAGAVAELCAVLRADARWRRSALSKDRMTDSK
jgi:hypothetical protein